MCASLAAQWRNGEMVNRGVGKIRLSMRPFLLSSVRCDVDDSPEANQISGGGRLEEDMPPSSHRLAYTHLNPPPSFFLPPTFHHILSV